MAQWINSVKPVAVWILIIAIAYQFANAILVLYVVVPSGMFHPLHIATGGILSLTFQGYVLEAIVMGFLLCYLGGLRAKDFALFAKKILPAIGLTLFAWGMIQTIPLIQEQGLQIDSDWDTLATARHRFSKFFMSQLFGNALFEELFFRALLISQFALLFMKKFTSTRAILFAIICSCIIFALAHIPHRLVNGNSIEVLMLHSMPRLFFSGLVFTVIYLLTKNIFVAVGIHALGNASPNIFANIDQHLAQEFIVVLLVFFFLRWCYRKWRKNKTESGDTASYRYMLISLSLVAVFSGDILNVIHLLLQGFYVT
jgi:membrane protease YdiL (CAAX protease family)